MKLFVKLVSVLLFFISFVFLLSPVRWFPSYYDVRYMGFAALFSLIVIQGVPRIFRVSADIPASRDKNRAVDIFQFLLAVVIMGNSVGEFGLYQLYRVGFQFDKFLHGGVSLLGMIALPNLLGRRFGWPKTRTIVGVFIGMIVAGVLWEVYEYLIDRIWNTRLYGLYGLNVHPDTMFDVIWNTTGVVCGVIFVIYKTYAIQKSKSPMLK